VSCWNRSDAEFEVLPGARIAQLVFLPVIRARWERVADFEASERGGGGFGHTGHS
jgi:dUTP pyrophosphatase